MVALIERALSVALVGAGTMGAMHARALSRQTALALTQVVDVDADRARALAESAGCAWTDDIAGLRDDVDGIIVATSTGTHAEVVARLLDGGAPTALLIEKPLAPTGGDADRLLRVTEGRDERVLVGHIERFNAAVAELLRWRDRGLLHVDARRLGPAFRELDTHVVHDLMIHDLDIWTSMVGGGLASVASVSSGPRADVPDIASAVLRSAGGTTGSLVASRLAQLKERTVTLTCAGVQVSADLITQQVAIHHTDHQEFSDDGTVRFRRSGVTEIPYLEHGEPLLAEHRHFAEVIAGRAEPLVDVRQAAAAVRLCDRVVAADRRGST